VDARVRTVMLGFSPHNDFGDVQAGATTMMRLTGRLLIGCAVLSLTLALGAQAKARNKRQFVEAYPKTKATRLDDCTVCHDGAPPALNPYGLAVQKANMAFKSIEKLDSDKDGASNLAEIAALTFPGDAKDRPGAKRDSAAADSAKRSR
jgi:hypothetical protein